MATMPEGPKVPAAMQSLRYTYNAFSFLKKQSSIYGKVFKVKFHNMPTVVIISDVDLVQEIFEDKNNIMLGGEANALLLEAYLGKYSLLTLDGEMHHAHRNIIMPAIGSDYVQHYQSIIEQSTEKIIKLWPQQEEFSLLPYLQEITLDIIMKVIFGNEESNRFVMCKRYLKQFIKSGTGTFVSILYGVFPEITRVNSPWMKKLSLRLRKFILEEISLHRKNDHNLADYSMLSILIEATKDNGEPLSDQEIIDELITTVMAGNETTAAVLSWMFYYMLSSNKVLLKLRQEIAANDEDVYLNAVFQESLRIRPIFPLIARMLSADWQCGEYYLPKGTVIAPSPFLTQTDDEYWDEPFSFKPERFINSSHSPSRYFPFGGGARYCIGSHFAKLQCKIIVKKILAQYDLKISSEYQGRIIRHGLSFVPYKGLPVISKALVGAKPEAQDKEMD